MKRILMAEQPDNACPDLAELLKKEGYRVFRALTSSQAVRWAEAEEPDLVLINLSSDAYFPMEVIGALKDHSRTRTLPIAVAGCPGGNEETAITCLDMGADFFLGSPAHSQLFTAKLRGALRVRQQMNELKRLSITDELTGLYNRRFFLRRLGEEVARAERHGIALVCLMVDLDSFKAINDTHGHQVGDWVLKEISGLFTENLRRSDLLARYGGDEFTILLSHNSIKGATILAEYLRKAVEAHEFETDGLKLKLTISLGLSRYPDTNASHSAHDLIKHADLALYDAKSRGRNRFTVFGGSALSHAAGLYTSQGEGG